MPYLVWIVASFIFHVIVPLVIKVIKGLGVGAVLYVGINIIMGEAEAYITANLGATSADLRGLLGLAKVDIAINILLSAISTRLVLSGVNSITGRKKDFILKA